MKKLFTILAFLCITISFAQYDFNYIYQVDNETDSIESSEEKGIDIHFANDAEYFYIIMKNDKPTEFKALSKLKYEYPEKLKNGVIIKGEYYNKYLESIFKVSIIKIDGLFTSMLLKEKNKEKYLFFTYD